MNNKAHTLIISTGNQDLKLICKKTVNCKDAQVVLAEVGRRGRRKLHQAFLEAKVPYKIVADSEELKTQLGPLEQNITIKQGWESTKNLFLDPNISRDTNDIDTSKPFKPKTWENRDKTCIETTEPLCNEAGQYLLFPAKLHSVVKSIQTNRITITDGIVFYTNRKACDLDELDRERKRKLDDQYQQEPVATGDVLCQWLETIFRDGTFTAINFLEGLYAFEGNTIIQEQALAPYDQPIAQKATHIIDTAIRELSQRNTNATAIVSHTGGIADAKMVITPSARLHFNGRILELHDSEHIPNDPVCLANTQRQQCRILPRNAILDAKHHACQRLWEGDFTGAWAVVSHIKQDDKQLVCDPWVNKVKAVADYMEGYTSKIPFNSNGFNEKEKEILWKAFQVEAALQNQQGGALIIRLLRALGTFREAMENELCKRQLEAQGFAIGNKNKIKTKPEKYNPEYKKFIFTRYGQKEFSTVKHNDLLIKNMGYQDKIIHFFTSMEESICNGKSLRNFRNDVTHNNPPKTEILKKIDTFGNNKKLWNSTPNGYAREKIGTCFLSMDMTKALFNEINPDMNAEQI